MTPLVAHILTRCTEVGDCWEWQGAFQSCGSTPTMTYRQKTNGVRRFIMADKGIDTAGKLATYACGNALCVNPDHTELVTRRKLSKRISKTTSYTSMPLRQSKIAHAMRLRSKISAEIVKAIRAAEGSQRAIAKSYDVSQATVSAIRIGRTWRDYSSPWAALLGGLAT